MNSLHSNENEQSLWSEVSDHSDTTDYDNVKLFDSSDYENASQTSSDSDENDIYVNDLNYCDSASQTFGSVNYSSDHSDNAANFSDSSDSCELLSPTFEAMDLDPEVFLFDEEYDDPMDLDLEMDEDYDDPMDLYDPMDVDVPLEMYIQHIYLQQMHIQHVCLCC
ncbi:hypothetical protein G6F56_010492 [Rhizopus delemar]|nr:hypothetical protein G6F56_010492 [Rhizopus delemar]